MTSLAVQFTLAPVSLNDCPVNIFELRQHLGPGDDDISLDRDILALLGGAVAACETMLGYPVIERTCTARYREYDTFQLPFPVKPGTVPSVKYTTKNTRLKKLISHYFDDSVKPGVIRLTGNAPADIEYRMAAPYCITFTTGVPGVPGVMGAVKDAILVIVGDRFHTAPVNLTGEPSQVGKIHSAAARILSPWRKNNY